MRTIRDELSTLGKLAAYTGGMRFYRLKGFAMPLASLWNPFSLLMIFMSVCQVIYYDGFHNLMQHFREGYVAYTIVDSARDENGEVEWLTIDDPFEEVK